MEKLQKKRYKAEFDLKLAIVKKFFVENKIVLDNGIKDIVYLLHVFGFNSNMSCEGHVRSKTVDTFRVFWPYVQIVLNNKVTFDLDEGRMTVVNESDASKTLRRLQNLLNLFNTMIHPFFVKNLEMSAVFTSNIGELASPLHIKDRIDNHWNVSCIICDQGVTGILAMPQEMLTNTLRNKFCTRTQYQMNLFAKFLQWHAINEGVD